MTSPPLTTHGAAELGLLAALLDGDAGGAYALVSDMMAAGATLDQVLFDVLTPLQRDVGARWLADDHGVADEHAATATVETVVALLGGLFTRPAEGTEVVVACAEGDQHSLPARMVATYLTYLDWRVTFLGATLPAAALGAYLASDRPAALMLSASMAAHLLGARRCVQAAHDAGVPVVAGGRAIDADRARALGADGWVDDPRELPGLIESWSPDVAAAEAGARPSGEAERLAGLLPEIVVLAAAGRHEAPVAEVRADLALLGQTVVAAVLLGDDAVVAEFGAWQEARRRSHPGALPAARLAALLAPHLDDPVAARLGSLR